MTRSLPLLAAAIALAACSPSTSPADNQAVAAPEPASTTNYLAQIQALPLGQREGVLLRAIRDSGQVCQAVTKSQATETNNGKPAWTATCSDGSTYILVLGDGGMMTVANARGTR